MNPIAVKVRKFKKNCKNFKNFLIFKISRIFLNSTKSFLNNFLGCFRQLALSYVEVYLHSRKYFIGVEEKLFANSNLFADSSHFFPAHYLGRH
jgi:hypothetical protein